MNTATVAFAGSRTLPGWPSWVDAEALIHDVAQCVEASGRRIVVGCAAGVDCRVLMAATSAECFAIGTESGDGFWAPSAPLTLIRDHKTHWLAGGPLERPLNQRLSARTRTMVEALPPVRGSGLVAFLSHAQSRGTLLACRIAALRGLPVVAFPLGDFLLPSIGKGYWAPAASSGLWARAQRWNAK